MNELRRMIYLQAMGVDSYLSRARLPGAAPTRRLAIVRRAPALSVQPAGVPVARRDAEAPSEGIPGVVVPRIESVSNATPAPARAPARPGPVESAPKSTLRFSLAAVSAGGWLWLEELEHGDFSVRQQQLLQAMVAALANLPGGSGEPAQSRLEINRFEWPIHHNRQLEHSEEDARVSAASFVQRRLELGGCQGLVLLGEQCETRVALDQLQCPRRCRTVSTAEMLRDPLLKRQAWRDLQALCDSGSG